MTSSTLAATHHFVLDFVCFYVRVERFCLPVCASKREEVSHLTFSFFYAAVAAF
jgi:hypothetical protein